MYHPNFCAECGAQLKRRGWRVWSGRRFCQICARRLGRRSFAGRLVIVALIAILAFVLGRSLRAPIPPLIVQRSANSPLSDLPVNLNDIAKSNNQNPKAPNGVQQSYGDNSTNGPADDVVYLCGARTKKGTPCRRRVHYAGERCYQHKGMPAMVPLDKLVIKP